MLVDEGRNVVSERVSGTALVLEALQNEHEKRSDHEKDQDADQQEPDDDRGLEPLQARTEAVELS